jgi:hypothetical protein
MRALERLSRRNVLRGMMGGAAITVGLPILECHLNGNGNAYAATGAALPPCFGTWFWGLGLMQGHWEPKEVNTTNYVMRDHLKCLEPVKSKINIYSGMQVFLDGKVNQNHYSGAQGQATGMVSKTGSEYSTSIDTIIGDHIGKGTRFRSLEVSNDGDRKSTWSARGQNGLNPAEISPVSLYTRIFGSSFVDPNVADFTPDPNVMVRHSVLSAISDYRNQLMNEVSATDKQRLDEYFTSVRDLEQKLAVELQKPAALPGCKVPEEFEAEDVGSLLEQAKSSNRMFAKLITNAMSCGQTRVFNISMGQGLGPLRKHREILTYHSLTHEEAVDPVLGYQVKCKEIAEGLLDSFRELVQSLDAIKEGDGTLLDRSIVYAFTDHGEARVHSMQRYPVFTAGSGGGRMKTGYHIAAEGDAATRVGLTIQRAMGVATGSWGTESNRVTKPFTEILT